jgi:hypothetical protein
MRKANTWAREDWAPALRGVLIATKGLGKAVQYNDTIEVNEAFIKYPLLIIINQSIPQIT